MCPISATELILNPDNNHIYHLDLAPNELAENIILVGDPDRVEYLSSLLDSVEITRQKREYVTYTGTYKGMRVSIMSSGIGTGNIDIVMNELDALANIDFHIRQPKKILKPLNIVRIGTCGALQADIDPGNYIISRFALGFDNVLDFYKYTFSKDEEATSEGLKNILPADVHFYISEAEKILADAFPENIVRGITCVAPGFYGPQGREVRAPLKYPDLLDRLQNFSYNGYKTTNLEMEASAIYGLGRILGHRCCTIDLAVANRVTKQFLHDYKPAILQLGKLVLDTLLTFDPAEKGSSR